MRSDESEDATDVAARETRPSIWQRHSSDPGHETEATGTAEGAFRLAPSTDDEYDSDAGFTTRPGLPLDAGEMWDARCSIVDVEIDAVMGERYVNFMA